MPCILENHEAQAMKQATELLGIWSLVVRAESFNVALCRAMGDGEDTKLFQKTPKILSDCPLH